MDDSKEQIIIDIQAAALAIGLDSKVALHIVNGEGICETMAVNLNSLDRVAIATGMIGDVFERIREQGMSEDVVMEFGAEVISQMLLAMAPKGENDESNA